MSLDPEASRIARRHVYFIAGFDPRGARHYHALYRTEAMTQQAIDGVDYQVGDLQQDSEHTARWTVNASEGGHDTRTCYTFLGWGDLVGEYMSVPAWKTLGQMPGFYWHYWRGGGLKKTWFCARRFWGALMSPLIYLLMSMLGATALGLVAAWIAGLFGWQGLGQALSGTGVVLLALGVAWRGGVHFKLPWLMCAFEFVLDWGQRWPDALSQRWKVFAQQVADDMGTSQPDEVLVVGHCGGTMAAILVLQQLQALKPELFGQTSRVKLLTLGQAIPMLGFIPEASGFVRSMQTVAASGICWLDSSAPWDPLCYGLVDPCAALGVTAPPATRYRCRSSRFDLMFPSTLHRSLRRDPFNVHFQYLKSTLLPVPNSYFRITASGRPLESLIHPGG